MMRIFLLFFILSFTGCQFFYQPSSILGKKIDKETVHYPRTKKEVKRSYGTLTVPCEDSQNICYLYADIEKMEVKEFDLVEFVFDEQENLEYVLYRSLPA